MKLKFVSCLAAAALTFSLSACGNDQDTSASTPPTEEEAATSAPADTASAEPSEETSDAPAEDPAESTSEEPASDASDGSGQEPVEGPVKDDEIYQNSTYTAMLGGEPVEIPEASVTCAGTSGIVSLMAVSPEGDASIAVNFQDGVVTDVAIMVPDGKIMAATGDDVQNVTVTVEGDTYNISGTGETADSSNPGSSTQADYELSFTCKK